MKLKQLGLELLKQSPKQSFKMIVKQYEAKIEKLKAKSYSKKEKVNLFDYPKGVGDIYNNVDIVYLTASDIDPNTFWQLYIQNNSIPYSQGSGRGEQISESTFVSMFYYEINKKKVLFVYPTSKWINWDALDVYSVDLARKLEAKFISENTYELAKELNITRGD